MPIFDVRCPSCGWTALDVFERGAATVCPCGTVTAHVWLTVPPTVIGDAIDEHHENLGHDPVHFTSRAEKRRWLKAHDILESTHYVGSSDQHVKTWAIVSPDQLQKAVELVNRVEDSR